MKNNKILKEIILVFSLVLVVFIVYLFKKNIYFNQAFDYVEEAVIKIYEEDNDNTLKYLEKAADKNDPEIYETINGLVDEEILKKFYDDKENISFGYAEYRNARYDLFSNKSGEAIEKLEKSAKQNNVEAIAFLASYLYNLKRYTEAYSYFKKAYELKNYTVYPIYIDMSKNLEEYKQMEELYIKYNKNDITSAERLRLGKFLIEKYDAVDSYKVLKPFIEEKNVDALFAKAQYLELEGELNEAMSIYKELYKTYKHTKSAIKLLQNSDISTISKRKENIELINQIPHFDKELEFIKANLYFENDEWVKAKEIYDKLEKMEYIPVYRKLGEYYENSGDPYNSINMYKKAFEFGDITVATKLVNLNQEYKFLFDIDLNEEYDDYLKIASKLGDAESSLLLAQKSTDKYERKKYALIALSQENIKALEILIDIANSDKNKEKIKIYTNILINNK